MAAAISSYESRFEDVHRLGKEGRSKHWTLDCGLDSGLDHGLEYGLDYGLDYGLEYNLHRDYRPTLVICLHL